MRQFWRFVFVKHDKFMYSVEKSTKGSENYLIWCEMLKKTPQISRRTLQIFNLFRQIDRFLSDIGGPVSSIISTLELSVYMQNSWAFDVTKMFKNGLKLFLDFLAALPKKRYLKKNCQKLRKSKLFKIAWNGEKIGGKRFLDFLYIYFW